VRVIVAGVLIAAAILAPLFAFGSLVRGTLERDVVARSNDDGWLRQVAARSGRAEGTRARAAG
jgi:hypothetical protein